MLYCSSFTVTENPAVVRIADRTSCHWLWRSSEVNDFRFIWKGVCHFLLVINIKALSRTVYLRQTIAKCW